MAHMNIQNIVSAVAAELGDGWSARPGVWGNGGDAYLDGPDVRLHMMDSNYYAERGRLTISGALSPDQHEAHSSYSDGPLPGITVSPDKAARLIAGDIRRRLLPKLRPLLDVLNERVHKRQVREQKRDAQVKALVVLLPESRVYKRDPDEVDFGSFDNGGSLKVMYGGDEVKFDLRFPADKAIKLAEFLGKLQRGEV